MRKVVIACCCLLLLSVVVTLLLQQRKIGVPQRQAETQPVAVKPVDIGANLTISPSRPGIITGEVGEEFQLLVNAQPLAPLKELQLEILYDTSHLSYDTYQLGANFLSSNKPDVAVDAVQGKIRVHLVATTQFQAGGALMTLIFLPTSSGTSSVDLLPTSSVVTTDGVRKTVTVPARETFIIE